MVRDIAAFYPGLFSLGSNPCCVQYRFIKPAANVRDKQSYYHSGAQHGSQR